MQNFFSPKAIELFNGELITTNERKEQFANFYASHPRDPRDEEFNIFVESLGATGGSVQT